MSKIAIITSLVGNRDNFSDPSVVYDNVDYFAFVDGVGSKVWKILPPFYFSTDVQYINRRNAKIFKILPQFFLPDYDYYFWVNVTHDVLENPQKIIDEYLQNSDIALFNHRERDCLYNEGTVIKEVLKDNINLVDSQLNFYYEKGMPTHYGLYELPSFVRKNNHKMNEMSLCWWEQICKFSSRDQLSLPFVLWSQNITPSIMPGLVNGWDVRHLQSKLITQVRVKK